MTSRLPRPAWRPWIGPCLVLLAVIAVATLLAFRHPVELSSDSVVHGALVLRKLKPQNLANDYAYGDADLYAFYTPVFVVITSALTRIAGSFDYALAWLVLPVGGLYLAGMTALLYHITRRRWLSVGVALVSTIPYSLPRSGGWGRTLRQDGIAPRTLYLAVVPYLFGALLILLDAKRRQPRPAWAWGLFGVALGLAANLHPVSALSMGLTVAGLTLLALLRGDVRLREVWLIAPSMALCAAPTLLNYVGSTESVPVERYPFTFDEFYEIIKHSSSVWPWLWRPMGFGALLGLDRSMQASTVQTNLAIASTVLSGLAGLGLWFTRRRSGTGWWQRIFWSVLAGAQVALIAFQIVPALSLSLLLITYLAYRMGREGHIDALDRRLFETCALLISMVALTLAIQWVWRNFEVWSLTGWVFGPGRGLRFLYLPTYIMVARLLAIWLDRQDWAMLVAGLALIVWPEELFIKWPKELPGRVGLMLSLPLLGLWLAWPDPEVRPTGVRAALAGLAGALVVEQTLGALGLEGGAHLPTLVTLALASGLAWAADRRPRRVPLGAYVAGSMAGLALMLLPPQRYIADARPVPLVTALPTHLRYYLAGKWHSAFPLDRTASLSSSQRDELELYEWARTQTPVDSVFYTNSPTFRVRAERSITHTWKDLNAAMIIRYPLIDLYERYQYLNEAYNNPADLIDAAHSVGADYIIVHDDQRVEISWPIAFQNDHYTVYYSGGE